MSGHDWELMNSDGFIMSPPTTTNGGNPWATKSSDVYLCKRCFQFCMAYIGQPPDESLMPDLVDCDEAIVKLVHES